MQGLDISQIQAEGLSILMYQEEIDGIKKDKEALKLALVSRPEYSPEKMFPEFLGGSPDNTEDEDDETEYDYSAVEWKGPSDVDKEEFASILRELAEASGRVSYEQSQQLARTGKWV